VLTFSRIARLSAKFTATSTANSNRYSKTAHSATRAFDSKVIN
jgi:hypothetical protein